MSDTIFTKIIRGEIPCHKVYEDEHVLAFLDVGPLSTGHTLVIPKQAVATLDQLSEASAMALGKALPVVAKAVMRATGVQDYNILQNNGAKAHQAVFHVHFHIIPKPNESEGLGISWPAKQLKEDEAASLAQTMQSYIQ